MHAHNFPVHRVRQCRGIAMIEVLISVLLLAIGIMGLVAMQASMSTNVTQAKLRSEASFLASQLDGQMWADYGNLSNYEVIGGSCTQTYVACTNWSNLVANTLPSGAANVVIDATNNVTVSLTWMVPGEDNQPNQYQIDTKITN